MDWPAITDLLTQSKLPTDGAHECLQHFVVAEEASTAVGCATLERHGPHALLRSVAVSQQHQRRGLAGVPRRPWRSRRLCEPVGTFREVGFKLGAWRDVSWWQCQLQDNEAPLRMPKGFA